MKPIKTVTIREIALFGGCLVMAFFLFIKGCKPSPDDYISKKMFDASQDSLHKTRNELGQEKTSTKMLKGSVDELKNLASSNDSTIKKLVALVNKKTISASVLSNSTSNTIHSATTSTSKDTIYKDSLMYIYPQYQTAFKNKWEDFKVIANKDTTLITYKLFNEFELQQQFEKQKVAGKWFKQSVAVTSVTNLNPHTQTLELKTFTKELPKPKRLRIFLGGAIAGALGYAILKR